MVTDVYNALANRPLLRTVLRDCIAAWGLASLRPHIRFGGTPVRAGTGFVAVVRANTTAVSSE